MKKILFAIFSLSLIVNCCGNKIEEAKATSTDPADKMTEDELLIYYTCPMPEHKGEFSDEPGACPQCGMSLAAGVMTTEDRGEFFGCPMLIHSHIRESKAGKCVDCGMNLEHMRLIK